MTKYSTDQINRYVKDMTPHTRQLVGTAMTVLKCDEEMVKILADEGIAFSVRMCLFALIAEGFGYDDVERLSKEEDVFKVVATAGEIRRGDEYRNHEKEAEPRADNNDMLIDRISVLLDEKLALLVQTGNVNVESKEKKGIETEGKDPVENTPPEIIEIGTEDNKKVVIKGERVDVNHESVDDMDRRDTNSEERLAEIIDAAGYGLREHISVENRKILKEVQVIERSIEGAKVIFIGRKKNDVRKDESEKNVEYQSGSDSSTERQEKNIQTGAEYVVWCLRNIHDLSLKHCDILYKAASVQKFDYDEIRALLYDKDEGLRSEEEMAEQFERILHRRGQARRLEESIKQSRE